MSGIKQGGGTVNNSGKVTGYNYGVEIYGSVGTVNNTGYITATGPDGIGVYLEEGGTVTNAAGATITTKSRYGGDAVCVEFGGRLKTGTLSNSGYITSYISSIAVVLGYGGSITNTASGHIFGGIKCFGNLTVTNYGHIRAWNGYDVGMYVDGQTSISDKKGGSIVGYMDLYSREGSCSITNAGIIGAYSNDRRQVGILLDGLTNTLTLQTGSVIYGNVSAHDANGGTSALVLTGSGTANNAFIDFTTLSVQASGTWTLGGVLTFSATTVSTGTLAITGALTTVMSEAASAVVRVAAGGTLTLIGASTLSSSFIGSGALSLAAGAKTIAKGASISVSNWSILGATASATLGEALSYSGSFTAGSGAVLTLSGGSLNLAGAAAFSGVTTAGAYALNDNGKSLVSGLTIGGTGGFTNRGTLIETGGSVTVGDSQGDTALLTNGVAGIWDIVDNSGIALGHATTSSISNLGLFDKTGPGVSVIAPAFANKGNVVTLAGTLDFEGAVSGVGLEEIVGASTLEFDASVANSQTIEFAGASSVLDLGAPTSFSAALAGFDTLGSNDAVMLLGSWAISGFSTTSTTSTLTLKDGSASASLVFDGAYTKSLFATNVSSGHTTLTYSL